MYPMDRKRKNVLAGEKEEKCTSWRKEEKEPTMSLRKKIEKHF